MTTITLPFINSYKDRHGKLRHYFRRRGFRRVILPGPVGSQQFMVAYQDALAGKIEVGASRSLSGTVGAVIADYYRSMSFANLSPGTQRERRRILESFRSDHGDKRIAKLNREHIELLVADRAKTPGAAHNFLVAIRSLLQPRVSANPNRRAEAFTPGQNLTLPHLKPAIQSALGKGWHLDCYSIPPNVVVMSFVWVGSIFGTV
jgi:hypothetical protein